MKTIFESRFMEVALSGGSQMTDLELTTKFEGFQHEMRSLLMSDKGYLVIDFTLRDLLAQLEGVVCGKKKNTFAHSSSEREPTSVPACSERKTPDFPRIILPNHSTTSALPISLERQQIP